VSETININKCEAVEYISHLKTVLQMKLDQCERALASYNDGSIVSTGPSPATLVLSPAMTAMDTSRLESTNQVNHRLQRLLLAEHQQLS
jgi:hypothetical protein